MLYTYSMKDVDKQATELAISFIQGNRESVCQTVLASAHTPKLVADVTDKLCLLRPLGDHLAAEFVRLINPRLPERPVK